MFNKIYIVSLSPSLDYVLYFDELKINKTNRPEKIDLYPAGKGIHIAMLFNNLNIKNKSLIFSNGDFENFFYQELDKLKIDYKKFKSTNNIRINIKLIDYYQTECSVMAPNIALNELEKFKNYLKNTLTNNDLIILSGNIPDKANANIYQEIIKISNSCKAITIVDTFGLPLNLAILEKPFLIKPNLEELMITTNSKLLNNNDIKKAGLSLIKKGAQNVLISLGKDGAIFVNKNVAFKCQIGKWNKKIINVAGAGDSMLAGFVFKYNETKNFELATKYAIICGAATCYSPRIANKKLIDELSQTIDDLQIEYI